MTASQKLNKCQTHQIYFCPNTLTYINIMRRHNMFTYTLSILILPTPADHNRRPTAPSRCRGRTLPQMALTLAQIPTLSLLLDLPHESYPSLIINNYTTAQAISCNNQEYGRLCPAKLSSTHERRNLQLTEHGP